MRKRREGLIVNFSSIAGLLSFPSVGWYSATKFAVEGLSEALRQEVEPLGIGVMVVEPSGFRTDWAGRSANESKRQLEDYAKTAGAARLNVRASSGKQAGDPARAAQAIVDAVESSHPPRHLLLGNNAFDFAMAKITEQRKEFSAWESVSRKADFPKEKLKQAA
jgi:short-subunit dehydrogenase